MREEFHGLRNAENVITALKQLYGWGTISANVWLPSLSELVGTTGTVHPNTGVYKSAMKGLNTSTNYYVDMQGGAQWKLFEPYNASGGGQKIWEICGKKETWFRSPHCGSSQGVWSISDEGTMNSGSNPATASYAVLVGTNSVSFTMVIKGITIAYSLHCPSSPQKGTFEPADGL